MEKKYFSLEIHSDNRFTRIFRFILGLLCILIALYWIVYNFRSGGTDWTLWITTLFLTIFGLYMVASSFGACNTFIEFSDESIRIKNNSFLPVKTILAADINKITVYPLNFTIILKNSKSFTTRFGVSDLERNEKIKAEILAFAEKNQITAETGIEI